MRFSTGSGSTSTLMEFLSVDYGEEVQAGVLHLPGFPGVHCCGGDLQCHPDLTDRKKKSLMSLSSGASDNDLNDQKLGQNFTSHCN